MCEGIGEVWGGADDHAGQQGRFQVRHAPRKFSTDVSFVLLVLHHVFLQFFSNFTTPRHIIGAIVSVVFRLWASSGTPLVATPPKPWQGVGLNPQALQTSTRWSRC